MVASKLRMIFLKSVFTSNLTFINPLERPFRSETLKKKKKKMPVILLSLYCFAVRQQTSTCRCQINCSIYLKLSAEESKFPLSYPNPQKVPEKLQERNSTRKT